MAVGEEAPGGATWQQDLADGKTEVGAEPGSALTYISRVQIRCINSNFNGFDLCNCIFETILTSGQT